MPQNLSNQPLSNAYTDAPALHPNLPLGSFHLLFWLFFHPSAWHNYIARFDPALAPDFTLAELKPSPWRSRLLIQLYLLLPLLVSLLTGLILGLGQSPLADTITSMTYVLTLSLTLGLMIGLVVSVAAGAVSSVLVGLAVGVVASLTTTATVESIVVPTAISLAMGAMGHVAVSVAGRRSPSAAARQTPQLGSQLGGVVTGVLVGVVVMNMLGFVLHTLTGLTTGLTDNAAYWSSRTVVVGVSFGLAIGWQRGIRWGVMGGIIAGLAYGLAVLGIETRFFDGTGLWVDSGLAIGLASGLLFGTSFGVTVVLPYVLAETMAGVGAGAWAGALGSWGRHIYRNELPLWPDLPLGLLGILAGVTLGWWRPLVLYPLLAAWNLSLFRLDQRRTGGRISWLRWHSAFWDEWQRLPLTGLEEHLLLVMERFPAEGQAALAYLSIGRQRWAAQAVQIELEARRLEGYSSLTGIAQAHRSLAAGELTGPASAFLRNMSQVSQDMESALNQTTPYHQRLAFSAIAARLDNLERELRLSSEPYASRFAPIVGRWQHMAANHLAQLAQAVEQSGEIDNPYVVGVPLTEQQEIFVGRTDIVARIEQLLLDRRRPPLLLYGQRRMGKTSLLRNLGRLLPQAIVPLFVDGQRCALAADYPDFLYNLSKEMTRSAEQQRRLILPPLEREVLAASPFTNFNEWLDEVERTLAGQGDSLALLALDEFEMLDNVLNKGRFDESDVLNLLRHLIQHRPQFKVMLAGSHPLAEFQRWAGYLINVQVIKVGYLAEAEARQLIEQPIKEFALRYEPAASQRVWELTRGHPALVQLLCYEIVTFKNEFLPASPGEGGSQLPPAAGGLRGVFTKAWDNRRRVCRADVEAAVARALSSGSFFFTDIQHNQINQAGLALLRFMAAQGEGVIVSRKALAEGGLPPVELEAGSLPAPCSVI
ncbi:MAG: ATP-binding protein [Anaerolineae bacterium]